MDSKIRIMAKAATWQGVGLIVMSVISYGFTGSFTTGGGIALAGAATGFVSYFLHEICWSRILWGRDQRRAADPQRP